MMKKKLETFTIFLSFHKRFSLSLVISLCYFSFFFLSNDHHLFILADEEAYL